MNPEETDPVVTTDTFWLRMEKRVLWWFIAGVVGWIGLIATDMKTNVAVAVSTISKHDEVIKAHETDIKDHEKRLTTVEIMIKK